MARVRVTSEVTIPEWMALSFPCTIVDKDGDVYNSVGRAMDAARRKLWSRNRERLTLEILRQKFHPGTKLAEQLLDYEGPFPSPLLEVIQTELAAQHVRATTGDRGEHAEVEP